MSQWPEWLPLRPDLHGERPYGAPQLYVPVRLNTNENPFAPSEQLVSDMTKSVERIARGLNRYPDRDAIDLRKKLAGYINQREQKEFTSDSIWAANGSNEVIQQLLQAFGGPGKGAVGFVPSYSMHELISRTTHTPWSALQRTSTFELDVEAAVESIDSHRPSLVFITSPNNPTGTSVDVSVIARVLDAAASAGSLVIVDEAYAEFARTDSVSAISLIDSFPNLVITRTMSKAFALAGARVGYLVARPEVVRAIELVRLPYHLSAVSQAVAIAALDHADELLSSVELLRSERDRMCQRLVDLGCDVVPSDANFLLFGRFSDERAVWQALLSEGVLIRDVGLPRLLRVTIGKPEENDRFLTVLEQVKEHL